MTRLLLTFLGTVVGMLPALYSQSFEDVSQASGVHGKAVDSILMAGGVAWFDYNNDRFPDLLLLNGTETTSLFRNNWDGTFTDVSESTGLLNVAETMGMVSGDFDNDGFVDLFISTMKGRPNRLLKNNGQGRFIDVSLSAGITEVSFGASAATGDYDGDGDLDIYVSNYLAGENAQDGGQPNFMYRNNGNFTFTEVAASLQLDDTGCGLGVSYVDFNNDGQQDLYVANDFGYLIEPNAYFQNDFPVFSRKAERNGTAATINAMGIAKGDYDNDGDQDIYVTNIRENPLFQNNDSGRYFSFKSFDAGVAMPELTSWGTAFSDFDLDGHLDLVVANGQVAEIRNEAEPQRYFQNEGNGTFSDASESSGIGSVTIMGRGLAVADYDLDGYPDLAINAVQKDYAGTEKAVLLKNNGVGENQWLAIEAPVNALRLALHSGAETIYREVDGGSGYLSHSGGPIHFGATESIASIDSLVVSFTNQPTLTFTDLSWNQLMGIRADGSWYLIDHEARFRCGQEAIEPVVELQADADLLGREVVLITRTETLLYPQLEEEVIELASGEIYRDLARTQDAILVDTVAGDGPCPGLRPVRLKVLPAINDPIVYPNPLVSNQFNVQIPQGGDWLEAELLSATGAVIFTVAESLPSNRRVISFTLPHLPLGAYVLRLELSGKTTHHKLIRH